MAAPKSFQRHKVQNHQRFSRLKNIKMEKQKAHKAQVKKKDQPVICLDGVTAFDQAGVVKVIIETPRHSKNKYRYSPESGMYECGFSLTAGLAFPFDFGFIPSTKAEDGDPLDVLVLMDQPAFSGCLVHTRLVGILEAEQVEKKERVRNDRLLAVYDKSVEHADIQDIEDVPKPVLEEIELFFVLYNKCRKKEFTSLGWKSAKHAMKVLDSKLLPCAS